MIDATLIEVEPAAALIAVDIWAEVPDAREPWASLLPPFGVSQDLERGWRATGVELARWWLIGPLDQRSRQLAFLAEQMPDSGTVVDMTGAIFSIRIIGGRWRSLLMVGGVFDAEDPGFGIGSSVGTLLHHMTVRYDVLSDDTVIVHVAPSYAQHLLEHLRQAAAMIDAMEP